VNLPAVATQIASTLIEAGLMAADRKAASVAFILADLRASPPDIAADYNAARAKLLGDADEIEK